MDQHQRKDKSPLDKDLNKGSGNFDKNRTGQDKLQQDKFRDKTSQTGGKGAASINTTSTTGSSRK